MDQQKYAFLSNELVSLVSRLSHDTTVVWGRMNPQQMVEHLSGFFRVSTNKLHFPLVTPVEQLPAFKAFLSSDKQFRENTKAPVLPEDPMPEQFASLDAAINDLDTEVKHFFELFESQPNLTTQHPVFGDLTFEEWILLHYKHVLHHLRQFGLIETSA